MISVAGVINGPAVTRRSSRPLSPGDKKVFLWIFVYLPLIFLGSCGLFVVGSVKSCCSSFDESVRQSTSESAAFRREHEALDAAGVQATVEQQRAEEVAQRKREFAASPADKLTLETAAMRIGASLYAKPKGPTRLPKKQYITYRTLYCEDGTESPTCTCGGSWRGCCSHHGGVDGCRTVRIEKKESASIAQPTAFDK